MRSTSWLDTMKRLNSDRKIAGKHPLLQLIPEMPVRISYFQGIVLAALCDDGEISSGEQEHLRILGISLSLAETDVADCIDTVRKICSSKDKMAFLSEVAESLSDKAAAMLFLCEFIMISNAPGHDRKELRSYVNELAELLHLANARSFFHSFCAFAEAKGKTRAAAAADARKKCPKAFLPFLHYFLSGIKEPGRDALLTDIESLMRSAVVDLPDGDVGKLKDVLSQILESHPDVSEYQLMQILLPVVEEKYASLKSAVYQADGIKRYTGRHDLYMRELKDYIPFLNYVCLMDLLTVCDEKFVMIKTVKPPIMITWTPIREPKNVAKANAMAIFDKYVKELENRCKR